MMKYTCQRLGLIFLGFFFVAKVFAQQEQLITGDFTGMSFGQFIHEIESKSSYHFYFDTAQTSNLTVNISVNQKPLRAVLQQLFNKSDFHFAIDDDMHVFITKKIQIQTTLPSGFFERSLVPDTTAETNIV